MNLFSYRLLDKDGNIREGALFATSPADFNGALIRLKKRKIRSRGLLEAFTIPFLRDLYQLLRNHVELIASLSIVQQLFRDPESQAIVSFIINNIKNGNQLSESLSYFERYFDKFSIKTIEIAEKTNSLPRAFERIIEHLNSNITLKKKMRNSAIYPVSLFIFILIVLTFWLMFIVPTFAELFADMDIQISGLTSCILTISSFCTSSKILLSLYFLVSLISIFFLLKSKNIRRKILNYLPFFRKIQRELLVMNFFSCMAILTQEKFNLLDGIDCLGDTNDSNAIKNIALSIRGGNNLSNSMRKSGTFEDYEVSIIESGEKSGDLAPAFQSAADVLKSKLNNRAEKIVSLIQPTAIAFIGFLLMLIAYSIVVPLYSSIDMVAK